MHMILSLDDVFQGIAEFVNKCLGPLGSEGFTWNTIRDFIIQICATIILFIFVKHFLWNKVTDLLEQKREAVDSELDKATESKENALKIENELKAELNKAQEEVREMISQAEKEGNQMRESIVNEAKEEAKRRIENAKAEINQEIASKNTEIRKMIVDVAFQAAQKIVSEEIDQDRYLDVVNKIIEGTSND